MATINYERYNEDTDTDETYVIGYKYSKGYDGDYDTPPMLPEVTITSAKKDGLDVYLKYELYEEIYEHILKVESEDYNHKEDYYD